MTNAADIIALLAARKPVPVVERVTRLPHGWGLWLRARPEKDGRLGRGRLQEMASHLAARAPRPPDAPAPPLSGLASARTLLWQHWDPPPREERGLRWFAGIATVLLHIGFALFLLVFAALSALMPVRPQAQGARVQLSFIGQGTAQDSGGGAGPQVSTVPEASTAAAAAPARQPSPPASAAAQPRAASAPAAASAAQAAPPPAAAASAPAPPAPVQAAQPVQVTQVPQPTTNFVLPPPTPAQVNLPQAQVVERPVQVEQASPVQVQPVAVMPQVQLHAPQATAPAASPAQVQAREVAMPQISEPVEHPEIRAPALSTPTPQVRLRESGLAQVRERELAQPQPAPAAQASAQALATASAASTADKATAGPAPTAPSQAAASPSTASGGTTGGALAAAPGAGAAAAPGKGLPAPRSGDDWGASSTANAGNSPQPGQGTQGLFNSDGSLKLPGDIAGGGGSKPGVPGSRQNAEFDANRAGAWLDRPKFGYNPTVFDKYWVPDGSVLQEWVRENIREMEIPIPGTTKKLKCVVSILQAGGACGLFDPNKQEQPATARPPPDIPVKRTPIPTGS